jgi:hypothetical protein
MITFLLTSFAIPDGNLNIGVSIGGIDPET